MVDTNNRHNNNPNDNICISNSHNNNLEYYENTPVGNKYMNSPHDQDIYYDNRYEQQRQQQQPQQQIYGSHRSMEQIVASRDYESAIRVSRSSSSIL